MYVGPYGAEAPSVANFSWPEILGISDGRKAYLIHFGPQVSESDFRNPLTLKIPSISI